ncbi:hypothetical protein [Leptospira kirschneri]|uniref:hypothetical protein n=1 Tax=Leptospira kirschneri TaxID=29507 RepID=UPI0002BFACF7|nr:hypothetical protein [Leptospira kirschneri]EMO82608.1 hypothetical protein LEP1GSC126_2062 [Leptospira kirschneri str. 200801774]
MVVRSNSASHSPWVVRQVTFETQQNAFLRVALETQRLASTVARQDQVIGIL